MRGGIPSVPGRSRGDPAVLFALPTPPPFAGPEINGELALRLAANWRCRVHHVRTSVQSRNAGKGSLSAGKVFAVGLIWLRILLTMRTHRPRVLYLFLSQNRSGFGRDALIVFTGWLFRARIVAHVRGGNFANFYRQSGPLGRRLLRATLRRLDRVILLGEVFRSQFEGLVEPERLRVIYNAVDTDLFRPRQPPKDGPGSDVTILFVGHLSRAKGFGDLLAAMPQVLNSVGNARVVIAGEWLREEANVHSDQWGRPIAGELQSLRATWRELSKRYGERLAHLGSLSRTGIARILAEADIFVLPSYSEGLPMSVLEAMAVGLPIVATPVGALPEILAEGRHCVFVPPGEPQMLAAALIRLARDPAARQGMGSANAALVRRDFSASTMARQLESTIMELAVPSGSGTSA